MVRCGCWGTSITARFQAARDHMSSPNPDSELGGLFPATPGDVGAAQTCAQSPPSEPARGSPVSILLLSLLGSTCGPWLSAS